MSMSQWQCQITLQRLRLLWCEPYPDVDELITDLDRLLRSGQPYMQLLACRALVQVLTENIHMQPDWQKAITSAEIYIQRRPSLIPIELAQHDYDVRSFHAYVFNKLKETNDSSLQPTWLRKKSFLYRY